VVGVADLRWKKVMGAVGWNRAERKWATRRKMIIVFEFFLLAHLNLKPKFKFKSNVFSNKYKIS
jgi:hypothetical protein